MEMILQYHILLYNVHKYQSNKKSQPQLRLKFPDASVPQMKTVYKYLEEFQATSYTLDTKRTQSSSSVLPTIMQNYEVRSNMGEMKFRPSADLLYITIL